MECTHIILLNTGIEWPRMKVRNLQRWVNGRLSLWPFMLKGLDCSSVKLWILNENHGEVKRPLGPLITHRVARSRHIL